MLKSDCDYELIWEWGFILGVDCLFCLSFFCWVGEIGKFCKLGIVLQFSSVLFVCKSLLKDLSLITDSAEKKYKNGTIDMKIETIDFY